MSGMHIGATIAAERKLRGLNQRQLADRAHVSHSLLTKVEQGRRPASPALISAVSRTLDLDRGHLTGQPFRFNGRGDHAIHDLVPPLRREILSAYLPPETDRPAPSVAELRIAVAELSGRAEAGDLAAVGGQLPKVLADLRLASHVYEGHRREQVMRLWAEAIGAGRGFTRGLGYFDLALVLADQYDVIAPQSADPLCMTLGVTKRAQDFVAVADPDTALAMLQRARDDLEPLVAENRPDAISVYGYLHLRSALATARAADADRTNEHWHEATACAARIGGDHNHYGLSFGPANVGIWGVGLAVELMNPGLALTRNRSLHIAPDMTPSRVGHHYIDLARGQLLAGDRQAAIPPDRPPGRTPTDPLQPHGPRDRRLHRPCQKTLHRAPARTRHLDRPRPVGHRTATAGRDSPSAVGRE
jgi:transcriptional regulator with XRE-family HTH domain